MQDHKPYLSIEPYCGIHRNISTKENMDLRTASQFRHGARRVLTSPIWVALFIMRSKHHNKSQWPRLGLRNCVETFFHLRLHRHLFFAKLSRVRLNQNLCIRRPQHAPLHRGMRHYTSYHNAVTEDPSCRVCAPRSCHPPKWVGQRTPQQRMAISHPYITGKEIGEQCLQKIAIPDTTNNVKK